MLKKILFFSVMLTFISCGQTEVQVELVNESSTKLKQVFISTNSGMSIAEFENVEPGESKKVSMDMSKEETDGSYFIRVPDLDLSENHGYFSNGEPGGHTIVFKVENHKISFDEKL